MNHSPSGPSWLPPRKNKASVLLITLGFVLLITVITVAFLVRSRSSLQTSQSYANEIVAKEIGEIGINTLAAQFQKEITDAALKGTNAILPDRTGMVEQNPRISSLIRQTTDTNGIYTSQVAKNGWSFDKTRWRTPALLTDDQYETQAKNATHPLPQWVYIYGQTGTGSNTTKDVIGRYAAMVYDVGGLIDINEAGSNLPLGDKGSLAFADLSALTANGTISWDPSSFIKWHSGNSTIEDFYGASQIAPYGNSTYAEAVDLTKAGRLATPESKLKSGENRFFSRIELIEAANTDKNPMGLNTGLLPKLRTRSESANRIARYDPPTPNPNKLGGYFIDGSSIPKALTDPSLKDPDTDYTFTVDRIDGAKETYTIKKNMPLVQSRFPLSRLRWLADCDANGAPNHQDEIKKYFGLTWIPTRLGPPFVPGHFVYTSPDTGGTGEDGAVSEIKTLQELCTAIKSGGAPREPDFFEWLKAAINPDSLGQTGGSTDRIFSTTGVTVAWEASKDLHILRIGANIIDQSDPDSIPTYIRSQFAGVDPAPFDSFGQENLPYINEVITSALRTEGKPDELKGFMQFELWNPNRNASSGTTNTAKNTEYPRDFQGTKLSDFRIRIIKGQVVMEPMVFVAPSSDANGKNDLLVAKDIEALDGTLKKGTKENTNVAWASLKAPVAYSQRNLQASDFDSPDLADHTLNFSLGTADAFFDEPYLVNGNLPDINSVDSTNSVPMTVMSGGGAINGLFGQKPEDGKNAILLCTVNAKPNFSGVKATDLWTSSRYDAWVKAGRPCDPKNGNVPTVPWAKWWETPQGTKPNIHYNGTPKPSGTKEWNAVQFYSDGGTYADVSTEPVTFALEVYAGGAWHTCQIYNNLDLGGRGAGGNGPQALVYSNDPNTRNSNETVRGGPGVDWGSSSNKTDRCFFKWTEWEIHKGNPNTDPRTERFGLTDQMFSTPGLSIRTHTDPWDGSGSSWNLANGLNTSLGTSFKAVPTPAEPYPAYSNEGPAPGWAIVDGGATNVSLPADLALNVGTITGSPGTYHSYSDSDGVVRPADARWAPSEAHPALPVATYPAANSSRPIILNRPFRSVAELGMVFRDIPWKSLDLFSPDSPDRRLLDIFSIEDSATTRGKINLNLAAQETLQALLYGTSLNPSAPATNDVVLPDDAKSVAKAIYESGTPFQSEEDLASLISGTGSAPKFNLSYKTKTENFLRALSSTTDTRSWQLMLDVVAQSGRITPGSSNFGNFVVEGQRRFFVYLTLDRITGEIIEKHVEPVYE